MDQRVPTPTNRLKLLVLGTIGVLVVVVVVLGIVFVSQRQAMKPIAGDHVSVEVSDTACLPNDLTVAAGTPLFEVKNTSSRAMEWEILNGVMVVAERENVAPGFTVTLTPRLEPGSYQMTCGLLSNPRGTLTVIAPNGTTVALPAPPKLADLVGPTAEYRVYAIKSADELAMATAALATTVRAGDGAAARTSLAAASAAFAKLAPVTHLFQRDADPLSAGPSALSTLDTALVGAVSTSTLTGAADSAARNAASLGGTVHATTASPHEIVAGAGTVVAALAKAQGDPIDAANRIAGVRKVVELFRPLTLRADAALSHKLDADLAAVEAALAKSSTENAAPATPFGDLSADLTDLLSALGLNASS